MKNVMKKNAFSIAWGSCITLLLVICLVGINISLKGTHAYFGDPGGTGSLTAYKVTYHSNWVDTTKENETYEDQKKNMYVVLGNMFEVPDGYEFVNWNTMSDGTGTSYVENNVVILSTGMELYAQWAMLPEDDTDDIAYGDVNQNGEIDTDDYLLIENHVNGVSVLDGQALLNADVNADGTVDLVDVDIVKQAYLGTKGYTGYLTNSPILIYDIYEGNIDIGNGGTTGGGSENGDDKENITGGGTGSGNSGTGSSASGNGQGSSGTSGNKGGTNSNGNVSSGPGNSNDKDNDVDLDNSDEVSEPLLYQFKFMNGDIEYASTTCEVLETGNCELVLPDDNPTKNGYIFKGWSEVEGCLTGNGNIAPVMVDSDKTYYACFIENDIDEEDGNHSYVWIIVGAICIISLRLIFYIVHRFKEKEKNIQED